MPAGPPRRRPPPAAAAPPDAPPLRSADGRAAERRLIFSVHSPAGASPGARRRVAAIFARAFRSLTRQDLLDLAPEPPRRNAR